MSGRRVEASLGHVSRCPWGLVVVRVKAAPPPPTSGLCPWGAAVDFGSSNLPSDSLALLGFLSSITCSGRVSCRSPVVALGSFGMWWVSPPCCGAVISVFGDFCCLWSRSVRYVFTGWLGSFGISISNSYVFWRFGSPCNCDSDWCLDCVRTPVVVALDGVCCVGELSQRPNRTTQTVTPCTSRQLTNRPTHTRPLRYLITRNPYAGIISYPVMVEYTNPS
jgi:hypothetical protein